MSSAYNDRLIGGWTFTCPRWSEYNCYITLPLNPDNFAVANPVRGTQAESLQGKFMYVHRNPKTKSVIAPCEYSFEIPSGLILPQYSEDLVNEAIGLRHAFTAQMLGVTNNDNKTISNAASESQRTTLRQSFASSVQRVTTKVSPETVKDYRHGAFLRELPELDGAYNNVPVLYVPNIPIGIQNFYAFLMLMEEPKLYKSKSGEIKNNPVIVHLNTLDLPNMTMYGWPVQQGIEFSEDAESPGEFNINFSLFITGSNPGFGYGQLSALLDRYVAGIFSDTYSYDQLKADLNIGASRNPTGIGSDPLIQGYDYSRRNPNADQVA